MTKQSQVVDSPFLLDGKEFRSRLLVGTDKYRDLAQTQAVIEASGANIVTVAVRRTNIGRHPREPNLLDVLDPARYTILPSTAGCYTARDAVRTLRLARELLDGHNLVKLSVVGDPHTLYPNVTETIKAAEMLVSEGFRVMACTSNDPVVARELESIGCVAVIPLAPLIGSGMGILNPSPLETIIHNASVPIILDADAGTASDASTAMELGCAGVLTNTAIATANDPIIMAQAMKAAVAAGRLAYRAGRKRNTIIENFFQAPV